MYQNQLKNGNTMLQLFYSDPNTHSFAFQMMAYISRLVSLQKHILENPNAIIITERSLDTDKHVFAKMLHADNNIHDAHLAIYNKWFDHFTKEISIDAVIYVDVDPEICLTRIKKRSRKGECNIQTNYLERCNTYYGTMIEKYPNDKKMIINGNIDYDDEGIILKNRLESIIDFCKQI